MDKPWFRAKRYGLGSGLPIAWQGWVVLVAFVAALPLSLVCAPKPLNIVLVGILVAAMFVISAAKTKGGWHWRWGNDD
jgi:membrane protease YdiL (CAAX protease family)